MVKKEIGGRTYYCWEDKEEKQKYQFERCISSESAAQTMMKAVMDALQEAEAERTRAWEQIKTVANIPDEDRMKIFAYDWLLSGFRIRDD